MKKFDITAFGEILIDFTGVGKTEQNQRQFLQNAGGAPANVLVCATKLGCKTAFLGKVGDDMHGEFLKRTLVKENVDTDGLVIDDHYFTTLAFVELSEQGERSFSFARKHGADTFMKKEEINLDAIKNSKIFHVGSLSLTTPLGIETTLFCLDNAKKSKCFISYDPNYRSTLWDNEEVAKKEMKSLIKYADIMKISDAECLLLTDESNHKLAAQKLIDQGVKIVCVTLGENGAYVATKENASEVKGFKSDKIVDTTGAGDSFWGAFLSKIAQSERNLKEIEFEDLCDFVRFANATASLCVEKSGAIRAMPTLEKVLKRMMRKK